MKGAPAFDSRTGNIHGLASAEAPGFDARIGGEQRLDGEAVSASDGRKGFAIFHGVLSARNAGWGRGIFGRGGSSRRAGVVSEVGGVGCDRGPVADRRGVRWE